MLQTIRERFTGVFASLLLGMLFVSFVFFGIGNFTFLGSNSAALVDGEEISVAELENAYQNQLLNLADYGDLPPDTLRLIRQTTLERLIRERLIQIHADEEGYAIGDQQIAELIQSEPRFQENGVFKKELYYAFLDQMVVNPRAFEAQQRRNLQVGQLQRGIAATAFVTPSEYRRYLNLYMEQRVVSIATFDIASLAETIVVRDEDVQEYYDSHPDDFMAPESVDFDYLTIDRNAIADSIEIPEDELRRYYEANSDRFRQDEQRRAAHILITIDNGDEAAAETLATSLTERAKAGEPFADLAREYSKDGGTAAQGGDLGPVRHSQMPGALGDAIFAMQQGEVYGPVRTDFGFHVVKLNEIIEGGPRPLDQVRGELLQELREGTIEDRVRELEQQLSDAVFDATDLESIAESTGLEVMTVTGFTRNGGEPFGANQTVIDTVYDPLIKDDRQISDPVEIDADRSIMVQVTAYHEAARRSLDEVRDDIVFNLQSARALNIIEDRSRRLREALEEGRDFEEMAFQMEATFQPNLTLNRVSDGVDAAVLDAIFRAKKPSPGMARLGSTITTQGDYTVFMVNAVIPGRPESIPLAERDQRKENLQQQAGAADLDAFVSELVRNADIERSEEAIEGPEFL
jgi:peptidyl-prolyl cis-trans isomerase D